MSTNSTTAGTTRWGLTMSGECSEVRIGNLDDADVGLDGAERIVGGLDAGLGQALNRVDLPTLGRPTIPHLRDMVSF